MRDVARHAGVSTQTVSRVVNAHPHVREETRRRVLASIEELDYRVNNAARSLGTAQTRTIGLIASDATLYGPAVGIAAIEAAARAEGRWVSTAYAQAEDAASVRAALAHVRGQGVDGIILVGAHADTWREIDGSALGLPVEVLHGGQGAGAQERGSAMSVEHLAALGHRLIARVAGPAEWLDERARAKGFTAALESLGLVAGPSWSADWSARAAYALAGEVAAAVRADGGPTAVVAANDQTALGLIAGLEGEGLRVPEDVSVVGFDDNPDAAYYRPSLTTVRLDIAGEARRCVTAVLGDGGAEVAAADPPRLIPRASTAPLR